MDQILPPEQRVNRELELQEPAALLDLKTVFGNDHPLELEIGIGKGYFLQYAAAANLEHNFIGIEIRRKYLNMARKRAEKRPIPNVRFVCGEAFSFIEGYLPPESLHTVHLYFPDPWPKKRHHKRRLFQQNFIELVHGRLQPGGRLMIATDHKGYWEQMCEVLAEQNLLTRIDELPQPAAGTSGLTNFEIKYEREGRPIYRVGYAKP